MMHGKCKSLTNMELRFVLVGPRKIEQSILERASTSNIQTQVF